MENTNRLNTQEKQKVFAVPWNKPACFSSLDEEIAAQQQVDALKEHKKDLMQQLFPKPINNPLL